jgi:hypothetical protein
LAAHSRLISPIFSSHFCYLFESCVYRFLWALKTKNISSSAFKKTKAQAQQNKENTKKHGRKKQAKTRE